MYFWASVEHKLSYKYGQQLPPHLSAELEDAAQAASDLDQRMARMREEIRPMPRQHRRAAPLIALPARRTEDRPPEIGRASCREREQDKEVAVCGSAAE